MSIAPPSLQGCLRPNPESGSGMIEFSVVAIPVLLASLGCIEAAQWLYVKQAVSLALLEAARAGSTSHAQPEAIRAAFERALLPLYPATADRSAEQAMRHKFERRRAETGLPPWQIQITEPTPAAFRDFSDKTLPIARGTGLAAINNDYQAEQHERHRNRGWTDGLGPHSGASIYRANTLVLEAAYLHEPLLPGMRGLLRALAAGTDSYSSQAMARGGYLPIRQKLALTMQSHPLDWPALPDGTVIKRVLQPARLTSEAVRPCHGIWCIESPRRPLWTDDGANDTVGSDPAKPDYPSAGKDPIEDGSTPSPDGTDKPIPIAEPGVEPDDPGCELTLCCVDS